MTSPSTSRRSVGAFVGREADLARLAGVFDEGSRIAVVTGLGGIGKTRLALEYGEAARDRWPGGVWFCDLSEARGLDEVCQGLAGVLGTEIGAEGDVDAVDWLARALSVRPGPLLLVLDNFEQVAEHAPVLDRFLKAAPELRLLVTSRTRLRLAGERVLELAPLATPDDDETGSAAADLFVDRARRARGEYQPGEADSRAIAAIVRRLDGIPLAIELVAARMHVLGASEILERLRRDLDLVASRDVDTPARHASLAEALEWSWRLLDPNEQRALAQAAVFRGGFDVELAEAVVELEGGASSGKKPASVLDAITGLREKSLLFAESATGSATRLGMYPSIRECAERKLDDSGLRASAESRHARAVLDRTVALAESLHGHDGAEQYSRLERETDNLLAVFEKAVEGEKSAVAADTALVAAGVLNDVASRRGPLGPQIARLDRAIDRWRDAGKPSPAVIGALLARGHSLRAVGEVDRATGDHREAAKLAHGLGGAGLEAECWVNAAYSLYLAGRVDEAMSLFERKLGDAREQARGRLRGLVDGCFGILLVEQGDYEQGGRTLRAANELLTESGDVRHAGLAHRYLGDVLRANGRFDDARRHYETSLGLVRQIRDGTYECVCLLGLAGLHHEVGELEQAAQRYGEVFDVARRLGARRHEANALCGITAAHADGEELEQAEQALAKAARLAGELGQVPLGPVLTLADAHVALARARHAGRQGDAAKEKSEREAAERVLAEVWSNDTRHPSSEALRAAARLLAAALSVEGAGRASMPPPSIPPGRPDTVAANEGALVVSRSGSWFRPPFGKRVDLRRHTAHRLVLWQLLDSHESGSPVPTPRLVEVGWPGERVLQEAGSMRVYSTVAALRRKGLRGVLLTAGEGYLLDPNVRVIEQ